MALPYSGRRSEANAEVLLWQSRFRFGVILLVGVTGAILRMLGVLGTSSLVTQQFGVRAAIAGLSLLVVSYTAAIAAISFRLRRSRMAGPGIIATTIGLDLVLIYGTIFLVTPPPSYDRALLLSMATIQLTQLNFGRTAAGWTMAGSALAYVILVSLAIESGHPIDWAERLWTLYIFALVSGVFVLYYGTLKDRLNRIAMLFERAQEGDFSSAYDESGDAQPDGITVVGRAYNRMRTQLGSIVLTDTLTGCLNRRGFEQHLQRELARAARAGSDLSLLALDVDHFKRINDEFGHLEGDEALSEIGALLRACARTGDVVARTGGEEFMLLAPDTDAAGALSLAERIVLAFRTREFNAVKGRRKITASIGVASDRVLDENISEALRARADEALYMAKRAGRDRVCEWKPGARVFPGLPEGQPRAATPT